MRDKEKSGISTVWMQRSVTEVDSNEIMIVPHCIWNNGLDRTQKPTAILWSYAACPIELAGERDWRVVRNIQIRLMSNPCLRSLLKGSSIVHASLPRLL
jgi:hypothetical protein